MNAYQAECKRLRALTQQQFEDEVFERVMAAIDFGALYGVEQELWSALPMRDPSLEKDDMATLDKVCDASKAMIEQLVVRAMSDVRRYIRFGPPSEEEAADCDLCRQLRDEHLREA